MTVESTDPRTQEGTPERAADRGRAKDLGFELPSGKPSLGDPGVVHGLLAEFGSEIVHARRRYNADELDGEQAKARVRELAAQYGAIIMGRDPSYQALPWHSPGSLGRRIAQVVPAVPGVTDPGEQLFLVVGTALVELAQAHERDQVTDEQAEAHVRSMLADTAALILGVR